MPGLRLQWKAEVVAAVTHLAQLGVRSRNGTLGIKDGMMKTVVYSQLSFCLQEMHPAPTHCLRLCDWNRKDLPDSVKARERMECALTFPRNKFTIKIHMKISLKRKGYSHEKTF